MLCPIALMLAGVLLAVYGYTRHHSPATRAGEHAALARLVADLVIGVVRVIGVAAFVLGPRRVKVPDRLTYCKARDIVDGRATNKPRPGGNKR